MCVGLGVGGCAGMYVCMYMCVCVGVGVCMSARVRLYVCNGGCLWWVGMCGCVCVCVCVFMTEQHL